MKKNVSFTDRINLLLFGLFCFLFLPFSFCPDAIDPTLHIRFVLWSILSLVTGLWLFIKKEKQKHQLFASLIHQRIFKVGGAFLLLAALSLFKSFNTGEGIFAWMQFFLAGSFLFISALLFRRYPEILLSLGRWSVVSAIALVLLDLFGQYWQDNPQAVRQFIFEGIMVNKNLFASSLFLLLPFILYCHAVDDSQIWKRTAAVLLPVLCCVILFSLSRAAWLALLFAPLPVFLLLVKSVGKGHKNEKHVKGVVKWIACISGGVFVALIVMLLLSTSPLKSKDTARIRLMLWKSTARMITDNPIFGVGPGQWRLILPEYDGSPPINDTLPYANIEKTAQRPHNDLIWVAAETGIVGGLCYLLFFFLLYSYAAKILAKADGKQKALVLSMSYGISGYLIFAMFSYPRERPLHGLLLMLMSATVVSLYDRFHAPMSFKADLWQRAIKCSLLVLLAVCSINGGLRLYSEIKLKKALTYRAQDKWQQVIAHIDTIFLPCYSIDPFGVPVSWYRGMANYNLNKIQSAQRDFNRAVVSHPYHYHSLYNLHAVNKIINND
ncbi:MAG: O-antigen ligase family protein [Desulfobulbaceae bacterium]|nr:O-antigen ligase family protein [Desulfobulbaceae bacterium]